MSTDAATLRATQSVATIPRNAEGPVFREPWQAEAFALALSLHERGLFTWKEWAATLGEEIKKAQAAIRVLVMHTDGEGHPAVDANLDTGRSIADLVAKIASMMASGEIASHGLAKGAAAGR